MPRRLDTRYSIGKVCLIKVQMFLNCDDEPHLSKCTLELFYGGGHLLNGDDGNISFGGYDTQAALYALLDALIMSAPDRDGENKIGQALATLR